MATAARIGTAQLPLTFTTSLPPDTFLLSSLRGSEGISELFRFELDLIASPNTVVPFAQVLGKSAQIMLHGPGGLVRHINGIVSRLTEGDTDKEYAHYRAVLVPRFWLWTKRVQSRVFQQLTTPEILRQVLQGLDVSYSLNANYTARNYCIQYRESDFAFASRLMEEDGIYYYFLHSENGHQLVLCDQPLVHPDMPAPSQVVYQYDGANIPNVARIFRWEKSQSVASEKYIVRDYHFELPRNPLEATVQGTSAVSVGSVEHPMPATDGKLDVYDYPGRYAHRFDGVGADGQDVATGLQPLHDQAQRTARLWIEREMAASFEIGGIGNAANLQPGYQFALERHGNADGKYLLTAIEHEVAMSGFRSGDQPTLKYENRFRCLPASLSYRPACRTARPAIQGPQTATVVGLTPAEPYLDRYGRVKVQFHWDRQPRSAQTSCWVRVAQMWAGKGFGGSFWPRPNHEVVVAFEEGDPDRPLIIGSVYNDEQMPPFPPKQNSNVSGFKTQIVEGSPAQFHGIAFVDGPTKGAAQATGTTSGSSSSGGSSSTGGTSGGSSSTGGTSGGTTTSDSALQIVSQGTISITAQGNVLESGATSTVGYQNIFSTIEDLNMTITGWNFSPPPDSWSYPWRVLEDIPTWYEDVMGTARRYDMTHGKHLTMASRGLDQYCIFGQREIVIDPLSMAMSKLGIGAGGGTATKLFKMGAGMLFGGGKKSAIYGASNSMILASCFDYRGSFVMESVGSGGGYNPSGFMGALTKIAGTLGQYLVPPLVISVFVTSCIYGSTQDAGVGTALDLLQSTSGGLLSAQFTLQNKTVAAQAATDIGTTVTALTTQATAVLPLQPGAAASITSNNKTLAAYGLVVAAQVSSFHNHSVNGPYSLQANGIHLIAGTQCLNIIGGPTVPILIDSVDSSVTIASGTGVVCVNAGGLSGATVTVASGATSSVYQGGVSGSITHKVGTTTISQYADYVEIQVGQSTTINASTTGISLTLGSSTISVTDSEITLTGQKVTLTGGTASITLNGTNIAMSAGNTNITLDGTNIALNGTNIAMTAGSTNVALNSSSLAMKSSSINMSASSVSVKQG